MTAHAVTSLSPRLVRVTFAGDELRGFHVDEPGASVRLLVPSPGSDELVMPRWTGNEWLLPDGRRAVVRTFTPRRADPDAGELDLDVVVHDGGLASDWATAAAPGAPAAVSGPARGYTVDPDARAFLLAGDETAIPAISQLLEVLPAAADVRVLIEVTAPDARLPLPGHPHAAVEWLDLPPGAPAGDALVAAVADTAVDDGTRLWAAGEAAAMQRIRRDLFAGRGLSRARCTVRGYWKQGRAGDTDDDT